ncbi:MAG: class C sortase [Lachnospiraceae bacterium]
MKNKISVIYTVVLVIILLLGLGIMLYPTISDWWNSNTQSKAIANYQQTVDSMSNERYEKILDAASKYNEDLAKIHAPIYHYDELSGYDKILDITGTGIMGYLSIPSISVELPIYHGTGAEVLNIAIGHMEGTSLPVGGTNTHAVIMAHRGLPSARLFSDLDDLVKGDTFTITVLNETLTYEVEEIYIVLPEETEKIEIIEGGDYVTLMTCTPYGVNSHRLLVRGKRINSEEELSVKVPADAAQVDPMTVVPAIAAPLILILLITWIFGGRKKKKFDPKSFQ